MDLSLPPGDMNAEERERYQPRRGHRVVLTKTTRLRSKDQAMVEVIVCDLSTSGFMAECMRPVLIGSYVSVDLPGIGPVHAQVRWQVGGKLGGKFLDPISLHRCDWTAARLQG